QRLIKQREKVLKSAAKERSADLIADFENQLGQEYSFDQDEVWAKAVKEAEPVIKRAQQAIAARCVELGIPERFAPRLGMTWVHRGYDNTIQKRMDELRRMARTQIEAAERKAITQIEMSCLKAQEQIAISGLTSEAAREFFETLPDVKEL